MRVIKAVICYIKGHIFGGWSICVEENKAVWKKICKRCKKIIMYDLFSGEEYEKNNN